MEPGPGACPLTYRQIVDEYFLENRNRLLDLAAFLDRLDRAADGFAPDFRIEVFREALRVLCSDEPDRTARIQLLFSDPTTEPLERLDRKSACGASPRWKEGR